jgi:membrane-bound metal-dependent hydrolase YbcI (DUF457 family)
VNFKGHKIGGIISTLLLGGASFYYGAPLITVLIMMGTCFIFSLFPDTDIKSKSSKIVYISGLLFSLVLWYIGSIYLLITMIIMLTIPQICNHRGFTHSIIGALLFSLAWTFIITSLGYPTEVYAEIGYVTVTQVTLAALCGFFTHFILDLHFKLW